MSRRRGTIWINITGHYCRGGIDSFWHFSRAANVATVVQWLALHRELVPHAYQWKYEPIHRRRWDTVTEAGVYLNNPFDNRGWRFALGQLPAGVHPDMCDTHPFVTFVYETDR